MRDTVFYMRAPVPIGPELGISDLVRDTRFLLDLDESQLASICRRLQAFQGFLNGPAVEETIGSEVGDPKACRGLARLLVNVSAQWGTTEKSLESLLSKIKAMEDRRGLLSDEELASLRKRLPAFVQCFPGLERQKKAQRLAEAVGLPLEKIELICDLRPVFDKDHDRIEGMIPCTTLKIVCTGHDGLPVALEASLSERDVTRLAKVAEDAKKKLGLLRKFLQEKHVSAPTVGSTREDDTK